MPDRLIVVVGAGFVGVATAVALAENGHSVVLLDTDSERIDLLQHGRLPFSEPGLENALQDVHYRRGLHDLVQNLGIVTPLVAGTPEARSYLGTAWATLVCVGTPTTPTGHDTRAVMEVAREWAAAQRAERGGSESWGYFVIRSTVLPYVPEAVNHQISELTDGDWFRCCHVPEFLAEGTALADSRDPIRVVIGWCDGDRVLDWERQDLMHALSPRRMNRNLCHHTTAETASLLKYASNTMLATRLAVLQEIALIADHVGADIKAISGMLGEDQRIGAKFLEAGAGYGGSCFPKDTEALSTMEPPPWTVRAAITSNREVAEGWICSMIQDSVAKRPTRKLRRIAWLGLSFKPGTSDTRASPAIAALMVVAANVEVNEITVYDPEAKLPVILVDHPRVKIRQVASASDACRGADIVVVATGWREYGYLPTLLPLMGDAPHIIDARNLWSPEPKDLPPGAVFDGFGRPRISAR